MSDRSTVPGKPLRKPEPQASGRAAGCAAATLLFLGTLVAGANYPVRVTWLPPAQFGRHREVQAGVNPNTAKWFELAQLPAIGETLAKAIVEFRETRRAAAKTTEPQRVVFRHPDDLAQIKGIGGKRLLKIAPFLSMTESASGH